MPELPGPPSSSEDEVDSQDTPAPTRVGLLADLTTVKTPRPPGAWAPTPAPTEKIERAALDEPQIVPALQVSSSQPHVEDGIPAPTPARTDNISTLPTPAPPGAWQATPAGSLRRKSILKVRFDVDPNTSAESMPEIPMVGPGISSDPAADSMSEVFPPLVPPSAPAQRDDAPQQATQPPAETEKEKVRTAERERSVSPPTPRVRRAKSPRGVRIMDAYGNETVDESPVPSASSSIKSESAENAEPVVPLLQSMNQGKRGVRIVDAMGREVVEPESEQAVVKTEEDVGVTLPLTRRGSLVRLRETVAQMADDLGESDE
jgi:hypothetical protein